jgi:hypothetical protein
VLILILDAKEKCELGGLAEEEKEEQSERVRV